MTPTQADKIMALADSYADAYGSRKETRTERREALRTALSQQSTNDCQSEPLTDEQIYECERIAAIRHNRHRNSIRGQQMTPADDLNWHFARAIEAAHGIGVTKG